MNQFASTIIKLVAIVLTLLTPALAYPATFIVPAFGTFSSSTGGKVSSGQTGTNTINVVGGSVSKISGKPTITIPPRIVADTLSSTIAQVADYYTSQRMAAGKVYAYAAGTTTPKSIWLDRNQASLAANPYTLDANGTAQLYGDGTYRVVIKDAGGVTMFDRDNLPFAEASTAITTANNTWTGLNTFGDTITTGPQVDVRSFYHTNDNGDYGPALLRALATGGKHIIFPPGTFDISPVYVSGISNVTISGQGDATILRPKWDGTLPYASIHLMQFTNCSNITFENIAFSGRVSEGLLDAHPNGLWFYSCDGVTIQNSKFYDMAYQDRSPAMFYNCTDTKILNNRFIGTDVVSFVDSLSGRNIVQGNTFLGSFSEGFSIQNDGADTVPYVSDTNQRSTIISGNYFADHRAAAFSVINSVNAGVIFTNNIVQCLHYNNFAAALLQGFSSYGGGIVGRTSGVTISNNTFLGPMEGIEAYGQIDDVRISENTFIYTLGMFIQGAGTYGSGTETLTGISLTGNKFTGPLNIQTYSSLKTYFSGEMVQSSGVYYQSIVDNNLGNPVSNTAFWLTPQHDTYNVSTIKFNGSNARVQNNDIKDVPRNVVDTSISSGPYKITGNIITNSAVPIYVSPGPSSTPVVTLGPELTTGGLTDATKWNLPTGVTVGTGLATGTAVNGTMYSATNFATTGKTYSITFTINSISAGTITPRACSALGTVRSAPGTYTEQIVASGAGNALGISWNATTAVVSNISIKLVTTTGGALDGLDISGNTTSSSYNGSAGVLLNVYKITNSAIRNNYFNSNGFADGFSTTSTIVDNSFISQNTFLGGITYSFAEYGKGIWAKTNNVFQLQPDSTRYTNLPLSGLAYVGTLYDILAPAAGSARQNICTTSGYSYLESYNTGHAYTVGTNVLGSDGNVYGNILADSGSASNAPITGGSYATYWAPLGIPAIFKPYGNIIIPPVVFASLGTVAGAGVQKYCTDCTAAATCAGAGTGHMATSNGTNWTCN